MVDLRSFLLIGFTSSTFLVQVFGAVLVTSDIVKKIASDFFGREPENPTNDVRTDGLDGLFDDFVLGDGVQDPTKTISTLADEFLRALDTFPIEQYLCPDELVFNVTEGTTHWVNVSEEPVEFILKSSQIFPARKTKVINGTRFGCACTWQTCLPLCCPLGQTLRDEKCVEDLQSVSYWQIISKIFYGHSDFFYAVDDYCPMGWTTINTSEFISFGNFVPELSFDRAKHLISGCVFGEFPSTGLIPSGRICLTLPWWAIFCLCCSSSAGIVMLAIFIVYSIVPELKNLHGLMFRSYVITCIGTYVTTITSIITFVGPYLKLRIIEGMVLFFGCSSLFWTNAISFDMWHNFRSIRAVNRNNATKSDVKKYVWYALYSWGSIMIIMPCIVVGVTSIPDGGLSPYSVRLITAGVILMIYSCTAILFTLTALTIRKLKKDTAGLVGGVNKHSESEQRWFNLFLKLFLIMGGHTIMWAIWLIWHTLETTAILASLELVQSSLICYFLVWKNNIKQSLFKEVRRLVSRIAQTSSPADRTTVKYTHQAK